VRFQQVDDPLGGGGADLPFVGINAGLIANMVVDRKVNDANRPRNGTNGFTF